MTSRLITGGGGVCLCNDSWLGYLDRGTGHNKSISLCTNCLFRFNWIMRQYETSFDLCLRNGIVLKLVRD